MPLCTSTVLTTPGADLKPAPTYSLRGCHGRRPSAICSGNWAGSPVYACTVHKGFTYWFIAPGEQCRTSVKESAALEALLNGLTAAEMTDP
jgi:hypothetical protein